MMMLTVDVTVTAECHTCKTYTQNIPNSKLSTTYLSHLLTILLLHQYLPYMFTLGLQRNFSGHYYCPHAHRLKLLLAHCVVVNIWPGP